MSHINNGACEKCIQIINKYAGFNEDLKSWFLLTQANHPEFHCADAGRGKVEQELFYSKGASKAHFSQSSHNFNCAIDTFFLIDGAYSLDKKLFDIVSLEIPSHIKWYGAPDAVFYERPHYEIRNWCELVARGEAVLVE